MRDTEACLRCQAAKRYQRGFRNTVAGNTLANANANAVRDWRIHADFAQSLISIARKPYAEESFGVDLSNTAHAMDVTTIDLCVSVFPWAPFRSTKAVVKMHTFFGLRCNIPSFIHISDGNWHGVNVFAKLVLKAGAYYIIDRGYIDFELLHRLHQARSFYVIRAKSNLRFKQRHSLESDRPTGTFCDQKVTLTGFYSSTQDYAAPLRRVRIKDDEGKTLVFLTNNKDLPARTIAELYRCRWQVELFFKWIKQHLRIKSVFGTSENAVKFRIWIAVSVHVLVAILKKRLKLSASLYEILQILSLTMFERTPLYQLLARIPPSSDLLKNPNQLILFD